MDGWMWWDEGVMEWDGRERWDLPCCIGLHRRKDVAREVVDLSGLLMVWPLV
jgi:hypothetical protein